MVDNICFNDLFFKTYFILLFPKTLQIESKETTRYSKYIIYFSLIKPHNSDFLMFTQYKTIL